METRRIYAKGSEFPGLAMARSLGDLEAQRLGASFEPEFTSLHFDCARHTLVVASDGVWDVVRPSVVAAHLAASTAHAHAGDLACAIVEEARKRYPSHGDRDDITAVVVKAKPCC
jgi:serine/threonine protein phosphatase PrpC